MSLAEKQALALRDLAVIVAKARGVISSPDVHSYQDARLRIVYGSKTPQALDLLSRGELDLKVLSVIWNDGDAVVLLHRTGSWEDWLRWLAKAV
jgi:hypothetical protein